MLSMVHSATIHIYNELHHSLRPIISILNNCQVQVHACGTVSLEQASAMPMLLNRIKKVEYYIGSCTKSILEINKYLPKYYKKVSQK